MTGTRAMHMNTWRTSLSPCACRRSRQCGRQGSRLLKTCVPFIQPDTSMQDPLYNREGLSVVLVVTRGRLMQLLATDDAPDLPTAAHTPPPPQQLHYTGKVGLTKAYVEGNAVRAVCGQWWIPYR